MRIKREDIKRALSLIEAAKRDLEFTLTLPVNESSASTIVRNIYECFRMLGEALLVAEGKIVTDHKEMLKRLTLLPVNTSRPLGGLENLRLMRHRINYYGYRATVKEAKYAISLAKCCFQPLYEFIKKLLNKNPRYKFSCASGSM